jgi:hypothetical protein
MSLDCDFPACRRFDAVLGRSGDVVELEERCADRPTAQRHSLFRVGYFER